MYMGRCFLGSPSGLSSVTSSWPRPKWGEHSAHPRDCVLRALTRVIRVRRPPSSDFFETRHHNWLLWAMTTPVPSGPTSDGEILVAGAGDARANGVYARCGTQNDAPRWRHVDRSWLCILRDGSSWWIGDERAAREDLYWMDAAAPGAWNVCPCDDRTHRHFKGSAPAPALSWHDPRAPTPRRPAADLFSRPRSAPSASPRPSQPARALRPRGVRAVPRARARVDRRDRRLHPVPALSRAVRTRGRRTASTGRPEAAGVARDDERPLVGAARPRALSNPPPPSTRAAAARPAATGATGRQRPVVARRLRRAWRVLGRDSGASRPPPRLPRRSHFPAVVRGTGKVQPGEARAARGRGTGLCRDTGAQRPFLCGPRFGRRARGACVVTVECAGDGARRRADVRAEAPDLNQPRRVGRAAVRSTSGSSTHRQNDTKPSRTPQRRRERRPACQRPARAARPAARGGSTVVAVSRVKIKLPPTAAPRAPTTARAYTARTCRRTMCAELRDVEASPCSARCRRAAMTASCSQTSRPLSRPPWTT